MKITFIEPNARAKKGLVQIDDARIIFRNLSGEGSMYNREGDKNFAVLIDDMEIAEALLDQGWNVKSKPSRDDGDIPFMYLTVKVKFNEMGPNVYLKTGENLVKLDEESVSCIDNITIAGVDLDIRPYDWETNGKSGRTAYLQSMRVVQDITDRFAREYYEEQNK